MKNINILLILIILSSVLVGAYGMTSDLPYSRAGVEIAVIGMTVKMGSGDLNPHIFYYPALFMYILLALFGLFFVFGSITGAFQSVGDFQDLYFRDATAFYVIARSATLLFMAASVLLTYIVAKKMFDKKTGIIAAAFMAFNITNVRLSHYALTDIPVLFFSLVALLFVVKIMREGKLKSYILCGFCIGLATATKYQALFLLFSLLIAHFLYEGKITGLKSVVLNRKLHLSGLTCFAGFFLGSPFSILDYKDSIAYFMKVKVAVSSSAYGFASYRIDKPLPLYIVADLLPHAMGAVMTIFCIAAVLYAVKMRTRSDLLLLGTIFIFLAYVVLSGWQYLKPRHIIHLFPLFFILTGRMLHDISGRLVRNNTGKNTFLICAVFLLLLPSFQNIWSYERVVSSKPVHVKAKEWIEANVPASQKIAAQDGIRLEANEKSIRRKLKEVTDKNLGHGAKMKVMLTNRHLFEKTYDIYELPYPWRGDYDEEDFDFRRHINEGVRFFVFTQELTNYLREPEEHRAQLEYFNSVKDNCVLAKKLTSKFVRSELGDIPIEPYVLVYEYKKADQ